MNIQVGQLIIFRDELIQFIISVEPFSAIFITNKFQTKTTLNLYDDDRLYTDIFC